MTLSRTQEAQEQLDLAKVAFEAHLFDQAALHLRRVLELDPSLTAARILQARVKLQQNEPREALSALDAQGLYHPGEAAGPDVSMLRVQSLLRAGVDDLALDELEKLTEQFPDDARPARMIAALCVKLGLQERAAAALAQVLRLEPSDGSVRAALARLLTRDEPQEAIALLEHDARRDEPGLRLRLARLYHLAGRDREAEDAYAALLIEAPEDETLWREAGVVADGVGDHPRAVGRLRHAVTLSKGKNVESLMLLATAHLHAGEAVRAGRCWWRAARLTPDNSRAWAGLLACALDTGRMGLVRRVQKTLRVQTSKRERQRMLAEIWQHAASGRVIRRATRVEPQGRAGAESPLKQLLARAVQAHEDQARENPSRADAHYHLAVCRAALDDRPAAAQAVQRALAANPNYAAAIRLGARLRLAA